MWPDISDSQSIETTKEIVARVSRYENPNTTEALYRFGSMLVDESVERAHRLDAKASMLGGFTGTILALLAATSSIWKPALKSWDAFLLMGAVVAFFLSSLFALWAMSVKKFVWFDDLNGWFEKDYLSDPDQLQRSYVLAMHEVYRSHAKANASKADRIEVSQVLIVIGSALLAFMLARVVWAAGLTPRP